MKRNSWKERLARLAAGMLCLAAARPCFAGDLDWKFSTSLNYETGKFGTGTRSSSLYIPFTVRRDWVDWNASVTLPYVRQTSNGQVVNVGGRSGKIGKGQATTAAITHSGLGDAVVRAGYVLLREDPRPADLSLVGKIKVPTADETKGLGTGKFDTGLGLELGKVIVSRWTFLADVYYSFIGDPPGTDLENQVAFDFGFWHPLGEVWNLTVLFEGSNALVSGDPAPRDVRATLDGGFDERSRIFAGVLLGLSDGSPDYGLSVGGSYRF